MKVSIFFRWLFSLFVFVSVFLGLGGSGNYRDRDIWIITTFSYESLNCGQWEIHSSYPGMDLKKSILLKKINRNGSLAFSFAHEIEEDVKLFSIALCLAWDLKKISPFLAGQSFIGGDERTGGRYVSSGRLNEEMSQRRPGNGFRAKFLM